MKITINLSTQRSAYTGALYMVVFALLLAAVVYCAHNLYNYTINRKELDLYGRVYSRLEKSLPEQKAPPLAIDPGVARKKVEAINSIIARETFSWTELLTDLEERVPEGISVTEISPRFNDDTISIKGMARSMKDVLVFVERLGQGRRFAGVFLLKHSEEKAGEVLPGGLLFTISARYQKDVAS